MNSRDVLGFVLIPFVLFVVATGIRSFGFLSSPGFAGVSEVGLLIAIALLIVGGTCLVCQVPPTHLSVGVVLVVTVTSVAVAASGVLFQYLGIDPDMKFQLPIGAPQQANTYTATVRTLIEFTLVLFVMFAVPRLGKRREASTSDRAG